MSKSKGNVIDPLDLIDEYGADALRFTLTIMAAQGRDVKLDPAAHRRLPQFRHQALERHALRRDERRGAQRRILAERRQADGQPLDPDRADARRRSEITEAIDAYRFNEAAGAAYRFVWNQVCDWYLELLKPVFMGDDEAAKAESQAVMAFVLDEIYKLLHPIMPFMTEELWAQTAARAASARRCSAMPPGRARTSRMRRRLPRSTG